MAWLEELPLESARSLGLVSTPISPSRLGTRSCQRSLGISMCPAPKSSAQAKRWQRHELPSSMFGTRVGRKSSRLQTRKARHLGFKWTWIKLTMNITIKTLIYMELSKANLVRTKLWYQIIQETKTTLITGPTPPRPKTWQEWASSRTKKRSWITSRNV